MRYTLKLILIATILLLNGAVTTADIAPPKPQPHAEPKPEPKAAGVEAPWTLEEIRTLWDTGITFKYVTRDDKGPTGWTRFEAEAITDKGFMTSTVICDKNGEERSMPAHERSWDDFLGNLKNRIKNAVITEETISVAAGEYACKVYTMKVSEGTFIYWMSAELPGMFVKSRVEAKEIEGGEKAETQIWELSDIDVPLVKLPWTRKQVQEAWKSGASMKYDLEQPSGNAVQQVKITAADKDGFSVETSTEADGKVTVKPSETTTWDNYFSKFAQPRISAKVSTETLEIGGSKYECLVMTNVREAAGEKRTTTLYVAKSEPGLLVKMLDVEEHGEVKITNKMTLTEFKRNK